MKEPAIRDTGRGCIVLGKIDRYTPIFIEQDGKTQRRNRRKQELRKRKGRMK